MYMSLQKYGNKLLRRNKTIENQGFLKKILLFDGGIREAKKLKDPKDPEHGFP